MRGSFILKNLYFLPEWYIEKTSSEKNKRFKLIIIVLLIINLVFMNMFMLNKSKLNDASDKLEKSTSVEKSVYHKSTAFECLMDFYEYIWSKRDVKNIDIRDRDLNFNVEDGENCLSLIKSIETSDKFIIEDLKCMDIVEGKNKIWEINLKLK